MPREIFAWVGDDPRGNEGIIMIEAPRHRGQILALVATEPSTLRMVTPRVSDAANARHATVRLVRYVEAEVIEEIEPQ